VEDTILGGPLSNVIKSNQIKIKSIFVYLMLKSTTTDTDAKVV